MKEKPKSKRYTFDDLVRVIAALRAPGGCPWDRKQTHTSLTPYIVEETYEVLEAIERKNHEDLRQELGDLLLQILLHAQIASERSRFTIADVVDGICAKIIQRHPHVFKKKQDLTPEEVLHNWERIKIDEKNAKRSAPNAGGSRSAQGLTRTPGRRGRLPRTKSESVLSGVPRALPALLKAYRLQEKTARFGFDWENPKQVFDKVVEETGELRVSLKQGRKNELEHELGDLFFALVNLARHLKIDPERALNYTNRKFIRRFGYIERQLPKHGKSLANVTLADMDPLWEEAKKKIG